MKSDGSRELLNIQFTPQVLLGYYRRGVLMFVARSRSEGKRDADMRTSA
jgi:hypothetical protein